MSLVPSFTASQVWGVPEQVVITDTSTGSDPSVTTRKIYFRTYADADLITPVSWPIGTNTKTVTALDKDYALNIIIQYLDGSGNVLYTTNQICGFTMFNDLFLYDLTQDQTSNYQIIQDTNYYTNKMTMFVEIDSGNQALSPPYDIAGAQSCYDRATLFRLNQNLYF